MSRFLLRNVRQVPSLHDKDSLCELMHTAMKDPKAIWDEAEIEDVVEDDIEDGREVPQYEFLFKQAVDTSDMFLGMSGKDESSTSCEDMVVKISLPGVNSASELDLDVRPTYLKLNHSR